MIVHDKFLKRRDFLKKTAGGLFVFAPSIIRPTLAQFGGYTPGLRINQNFETASSGYDNNETWTPVGTDANNIISPAQSTVHLVGNQSLEFSTTNAGGPYTKCVIDPSEEWYFTFKLRPHLASANSSFSCFAFLDAGGTVQFRVRILASSSRTVNIVAGNQATTIGGLTLDTTYTFFGHCKRSTSSNGIGEICFSTDGSRPTSGNNYATYTNGTSTGFYGQIVCGIFSAGTTTVDCFMDAVQISRVQKW
jgi:hypothetical protein